MRLIDADAIELPRGFFEKVDNVPKFYEWLDKQPRVDVEPVKHGRWIVDKNGYPSIICSECGVKIPMVAGWCMDAHINYCPSCGAKMDEVK